MFTIILPIMPLYCGCRRRYRHGHRIAAAAANAVVIIQSCLDRHRHRAKYWAEALVTVSQITTGCLDVTEWADEIRGPPCT